MEKLIRLSNFPEIEYITSTLVMQQEIKIYFHDFENNSYELHFPHIYGYKYSIDTAFSTRIFEYDDKQTGNEMIFSAYQVLGNSDYINEFVHNTDGIYGNENDFHHYIIFEYIDARMELIATKPPMLRCLMKKHLS